jgi:predicted GNAT family N-acyltransferase
LPERLGPYPRVPVILLARLAVHNRFRGRGVGEQLLVNALDRSVSLSRQVGCRGVIVEAYPTAVEFYRKYGFIDVGKPDAVNNHRMFIDLRTVARAQVRSLGDMAP